MNYDEKLQNVSVLGAAGKMGSGILLLTAVEMADLSLKPENKGKTFCLNAIDVSHEGLAGLMKYLKDQVMKLAEKKTVALRKLYQDRADLIENEDVIREYVFDVMNIVRPVTTIESAYHSQLVFEAIIENLDLKKKLLSQINENNPYKPWFFSNTSSIPIHVLDEAAKLDGRILGFHFYNPPAVQRLVELITTPKNPAEMVEVAAAQLDAPVGARPLCEDHPPQGSAFTGTWPDWIAFTAACSARSYSRSNAGGVLFVRLTS